MKPVSWVLLALVAAVLSAVAAEAQTITGRVLNAQSGLPLSSAQVSIPALELGSLANAGGQYTIANVPVGTHAVTVQLLGYRTATQEVIVAAGQTVTVDFTLDPAALALDELVVTGTAGGTQRRAVGAAVERVDFAETLEMRPVNSIEQALASSTPGVSILAQDGFVGGGGQIRLRGNSSAAIPGDPIIYVDGVRMNADRGEVGRHTSVSRLQDIDPRDIESIEVIKGPAAATLYGTEAANGVINITTRRGVIGEPVFDATVELGASWLPDKYITQGWTPHWSLTDTGPFDLDQSDLIRTNLRDIELVRSGDDIFDLAPIQRYNIGVRGGTDLIRYAASVTRNHLEGVTAWNWDTRTSARGNIQVTANESTTINLNFGYAEGYNSRTEEDFFGSNFGWGGRPTSIFDSNGDLTIERGFSNNPDFARSDVQQDWIETQRTTLSMELRHDPTDWLTHRLVFGLDNFGQSDNRLVFFDPDVIGPRFNDALEGLKEVNTLESPTKTLDLSGTVTLDLTDDLNSQTSYGIQYYNSISRGLTSSGTGFATRALTTVSSAAVPAAGETFVENTTVGVYVQEQLGWQNRIFLTGAVRFDDNSAFGTGFDAAVYPKVSGTWVLSEEEFFDVDFVEQLRLRAAWGEAGQQPDAFAAARLYQPVTGPNSQPALTPESFGNPDLGPEVGSEIEAGFDADLFEGRLALNVTGYWRTTRDAMVLKPVPPSVGFTANTLGSTQLVNLGEVKAWGKEIAVNAVMLDEGNLRWDANLALAFQDNEITDLGGVSRIPVQRSRSHAEGYPLASVIEFRVLSAEFVQGDRGSVTNLMCDGGTGPEGSVRNPGGVPVPCGEAPRVYWGRGEANRIASLTNTFTLFQDWQLNMTMDYKGGHWMSSEYIGARYSGFRSAPNTFLQDSPIGMAYRSIARSGYSNHKGGFAKLREVSLAYTLSDNLASRMGASRARIQVGMRNIATMWRAQSHIEREHSHDPEMNRPEENFGGEAGGGWPPTSQLTVNVSVSF